MKRTIYHLLSYYLLTAYLLSCSPTEQISPDYNQISEKYLDSNLDSAIYFANQSLSLGLGDEKDYYSYYLLGYCHDYKEQLITAVDSYLNALAIIPNNIDSKNDHYWILNNLGRISDLSSNYRLAIDFYKKALPLASEKDQVGLSYNLANAYRKKGDYEAAKEVLLDGMDRAIANGDENRQVKLNYRFGQLYTDLQKYDKARSYFQTIINYDPSGTGKYKKYIHLSYQSLGHIDIQNEAYEDALMHYQNALKVKTTDKAKYITYLDLGMCLTELGRNEEALVYLAKAESTYPSVTQSKENIELFNVLKKVHYQLGDFEKSFAYSEIFHEEINAFIVFKEQVEKKFNAVRIQEKVENHQQEQHWTKKLTLYEILLLVAGVAILLIGGYFYWVNHKKKKVKGEVFDLSDRITSFLAAQQKG